MYLSNGVSSGIAYFPRPPKNASGQKVSPLACSGKSPVMTHRDRRRFDGQPSLSGHCGHGPIFIKAKPGNSIAMSIGVFADFASLAEPGLLRLLLISRTYGGRFRTIRRLTRPPRRRTQLH